MSVKSASKWAIHGSICGCAWSAEASAAVIRRRTSTQPSIFTAPNIRSSAPLNPARRGYGVTWTNSRLEKLLLSQFVHLTILIPMRKLLPIFFLTFSVSPFLVMASLAPAAAAQSQSGDPSQRPTLNRHPSSDPQATPAPTPSSAPTPAAPLRNRRWHSIRVTSC